MELWLILYLVLVPLYNVRNKDFVVRNNSIVWIQNYFYFSLWNRHKNFTLFLLLLFYISSLAGKNYTNLPFTNSRIPEAHLHWILRQVFCKIARLKLYLLRAISLIFCISFLGSRNSKEIRSSSSWLKAGSFKIVWLLGHSLARYKNTLIT